MNPLSMPSKVVLVWNKVGQPKQRTELQIPKDAMEVRTGTLLFEIDEKDKWTVALKPERT